MIAEMIGRLTQRFTSGAREAVVAAMDEAFHLGHDSVGDEDLLIGALASDAEIDGVFAELGVTAQDVRDELERQFVEALANIGIDYGEVCDGAGEDFRLGGLAGRRIAFSPLSKKALERSLEVALEFGENEIRAEHVLFGAVSLDNGKSARTLENLGVDVAVLRERLTGTSG